MSRVGLITGVTGQLGSIALEIALEKGDVMHGIVRRSSLMKRDRIDHLRDKVILHYGDLSDNNSIINIINLVKPDYIMHYGACSHVKISFENPHYAIESIVHGTLSILEAVRNNPELRHKTRILHSGTSEQWGLAPAPQNENTPFKGQSPYAIAKIAAYNLVQLYREAYGLFACNVISNNMEGPTRGENFVTKKITNAVARIKLGLQKELCLGNLKARRDFMYAKEAAEAHRLIIEASEASDYVVGTGISHSVEEFLEEAFSYVGLRWQDYVTYDKMFDRPSEVINLCGDASKIKEKLGWEPKTSFKELVHLMIDHDLQNCARESTNMRVNRQSMGGSFGG